jgi:nucleoside-diphosphate-sugar epimerase
VAESAVDCDVVFHVAGLAPRSAPAKVLRWVHVAGAENVLTGVRHQSVPRLVHVSCADVTLHPGDRMHWDENRTLSSLPLGAHARTKLMGEELLLAASDDRLTVTALRPALIWGPGDDDGLAALAREARKGFPLFGGGRNVVATTHIDNLLQALLSAASADDVAGRAYYITDGEFHEAREFFARLLAALGLPAPRASAHLGLARAGQRVRALWAGSDGSEARLVARATSALFDLSAATKDLGYEPRVAFDEALEQLGRWLRDEGGVEALLTRARQFHLLYLTKILSRSPDPVFV